MKPAPSLRVAYFVVVVLLGALGACSSKNKPPSTTVNQTGGVRAGGSVTGGGGSGGAKTPSMDGGMGGSASVNCDQVQATNAKSKGERCSCNSECQTGFCADGYCCSSACTETCKACNLNSALGECSFVPAGVPPSKPGSCVAEAQYTCGLNGKCDGKGACQKWPKSTLCQDGVCSRDALVQGKGCDGAGHCSEPLPTTCWPFSCDSSKNPDSCFGSCIDNGQCAAGQICEGGSCGKKGNGTPAKAASECASGNLADGVCCNSPCNSACEACNLPGKAGVCGNLGIGLKDSRCPSTSSAECGGTGECDGRGQCTLYPANTPCASASCTGPTMASQARTCDGKGTCRPANLQDCGKFLCADGICKSECKSDNDCESGLKCTQGRCGDKLNGQKCTSASECSSKQCVDGVCCESECQGACRSCAVPGSLGMCVMAAKDAVDPRKTCVDKGVATCGTNGRCDGAGECAKYEVGETCADSTCESGAFTPPSTCSEAGQCEAPRGSTCFPFKCADDKVCFHSCTTDADCYSGQLCLDAQCGKKPNGAICSAGSECESTICAQGVCCNSSCTDACKTCNLASALGTCTGVPDGRQDPHGKCQSTTDDPICGLTGVCKGGACANKEKGVWCKGSSCDSASSEIRISTCDGEGLCDTPAPNGCSPYVCAAGACKTICESNDDCIAPRICQNKSCGLRKNGAACAAGKECESGFCTEGVCCDSACSDATSGGLCKSCKVANKVGTCTQVPAGGLDPKGLCKASDLSKADCSNSGTCNGAGGCSPWDTSKACRQASCQGSTWSKVAFCDGKGACPAAGIQGCNPYICSTTSPTCLTTCTNRNQCTDNLECLAISNKCDGKLGPGAACKANTDCLSNFCTEGVCCNNACIGGCQSCAIAGKLGTCTSLALGATPRDTTTCATTSNTCGNTGKCNGSNGCQLAASGKVCGSASCAGPVSGTLDGQTVSQSVASVPAPLCNGSGQCMQQSTAACNPFQCNATTGLCKSSCQSTSGDCYSIAPATVGGLGGNSCVGSTCGKKPPGQPCTNGFACDSGNCVDGVCCNSACSGLCEACNLTGTVGTCTAVPAGTDEAQCTVSAPCGNTGKCTALKTCAQAPDTTVCTATQSCTGAIMSGGPSTCSGSGTCKSVPDQACQPGYKCSGNICATSCTNDTVCADGYQCSDGACKKKLAETCTGNSDCASNNCVDNGTGTKVCCSAACSDSACGSKAFCNTNGTGCQTHAGEVCDAPSCTDGVVTSAGTCNGSGLCTGKTTTNCSPYTCNGAGCGTSCTPNTSTGCASGYTCDGAGVCKLVNGASCEANGECQSGQCIATGAGGAKVCCATGCTNSLTCGSTAYCAANGSGCKPHVLGDACTGASGCTPDGTSRIPTDGTCNASLDCTQTPISCGGFACSNGTCATGCTEGTSTGCTTGKVCSGGVCVTPASDGVACTRDNDCTNKHCVSSGVGNGMVCCATACPGTSCVKAQCKADFSGCEPEPNGTSCGSATCSGANLLTYACQTGSCVESSAECPSLSCTAGACDPVSPPAGH